MRINKVHILLDSTLLCLLTDLFAVGRCEVLVPGADLRGCDFRNVNFKRGLVFRRTIDLQRADLRNADFTGNQTLDSIIFNHADLRNTKFSNTKLKNVSFIGAKFYQNVISGITWNKIKLDGARMENVAFLNSNLDQVSAEGIQIIDSRFQGVRSRSSKFQRAEITNTTIINSAFSSSNFSNATLTGIVSTTDFSYALFISAKLVDLNILAGVSFAFANLTSARLTENKIGNKTNFEGSIWVNGERCPNPSIGDCLPFFIRRAS